MDITKHNFEEEFDSIKKVIEESTFFAIDGEFTGLSSESMGRLCGFDTPGDRYKKLREGVSDFLLIQFGLCAFKVNKGEKKYEARPYNFYIFPHPQDQQTSDRRFLCQSSSINFLISQGFDFNKVFKEGIPYMTQAQEDKLRANMERRQAERINASFNALRSPDGSAVKKSFVVPDDCKEYIANIREKIDAYLDSEETGPLAFPPSNAFQRKMVYQSLGHEYPSVRIETKTGDKKERFIAVTKCSNEDPEEREKKIQAMEQMKLDLQLGFTKVMRLITESGKLIVGHNMYLDVIHSVNHFYGPVPPELDDFKDMLGNILPRLLDTKLMASTSPFREHFMGTSLEEVKFTTAHQPFKAAQVELPDGFNKYSEGGGAFHEAGYDAFVTGSCFISMINFLGQYQNPATNFLLPANYGVQPFVNKLFMMRVQDIPYVNLAGPDVEPNRDHVFHITFPEEWRSDDLYQLFEPYGTIQISWLTNTTAYVGLHKKENAKSATTGLCQGNGAVRIISYTLHRHMMQARCDTTPHHSSFTTDTTTTTTVQPTSSHTKLERAGTKRRSSPTSEFAYPPTKSSRRSLTSEAVTCPSIPEEDEKVEDEETEKLEVENEGEEEKNDEEDGDEDVGVPVSSQETRESLKGSREGGEDLGEPIIPQETEQILKEKDVAKAENIVSPNGNKLFEEPDVW